jgi:hypothetical protein
MKQDWREKQKKEDHIFDICGAAAGTIALIVMAHGADVVPTIFYGLVGAFAGVMTARMRTISDGWKGWVGAIAFWWGLPILIWIFGN